MSCERDILVIGVVEVSDAQELICGDKLSIVTMLLMNDVIPSITWVSQEMQEPSTALRTTPHF